MLRYIRPAWLDVAKVGLVDLVHCGKVDHVSEENVALDDIGDV